MYEVYRAAGDGAQELRGPWNQAEVDVEHLESVAGLQYCPEGLDVACQGDRNEQTIYAVIRGRWLTFDWMIHLKCTEIKNLKSRATEPDKRWGKRDFVDDPKFMEFEAFVSEGASLINQQLDLAAFALAI